MHFVQAHADTRTKFSNSPNVTVIAPYTVHIHIHITTLIKEIQNTLKCYTATTQTN